LVNSFIFFFKNAQGPHGHVFILKSFDFAVPLGVGLNVNVRVRGFRVGRN